MHYRITLHRKGRAVTDLKKPLHLICRQAFTAANGQAIEARDYSGFAVVSPGTAPKYFLRLLSTDADFDAIEVTPQMRTHFIQAQG
jgi:hypothetical protein